MDLISLPMIVTADTTLEDAFEVMKTAGRSGVVLKKSSEDFRLYTAGEIVINLAHGKTMLDQIPGEEVDLPNITSVAQETPEPYLDMGHLVKALDLSKKYGVLAVGHSGTLSNATVLLSSRHLLAELESSPEDCYCETCSRPGPRGGKCKKDGGTIQCR